MSEPTEFEKTAEEFASIPHWCSPNSDVLNLVEGNGAHVIDNTGEEYLDFISQLYCVNAGYDCEPIANAMYEQMQQIPYVASAKHNDTREKLAQQLRNRAPDSLTDVFFSVTGSEANEAAIQLARNYTDSHKILTRWRSYHGGTYGAGSLTGDPETRKVFEPHASTTGNVKFLPPMSHRSPFNADSPEELADQAARHVEFIIRNEGPDTIAAIMMEPIAGSSGAYTAPPTYFEQLRELCDEYNILLIVDEVLTGFGRCGDWFGIQTEDVIPDMITFAKGVTNAYAPLAGVITNQAIAEHVRDDGFDIGQTFGGHPVSCAAGLAAIDIYEDKELIENVQSLEPYIEKQFKELEEVHEVVGDVRGRGFLWAVEFTDPETGDPIYDPRIANNSDNPVEDVIKEAQDRGVLFGAGRPTIQLMISPPLLIDKTDIDEAATVLNESISAVFE